MDDDKWQAVDGEMRTRFEIGTIIKIKADETSLPVNFVSSPIGAVSKPTLIGQLNFRTIHILSWPQARMGKTAPWQKWAAALDLYFVNSVIHDLQMTTILSNEPTFQPDDFHAILTFPSYPPPFFTYTTIPFLPSRLLNRRSHQASRGLSTTRSFSPPSSLLHPFHFSTTPLHIQV